MARLGGDLANSRELAERALAQAPGDPQSVWDLILIEYESGNFTQGEANVDRLLEIISRMAYSGHVALMIAAVVIPLAARITQDPNRLDAA